jgi:hypothetical protein
MKLNRSEEFLSADICEAGGHSGTRAARVCGADAKPFRTGVEIVRVLVGESNLSWLVNAILAETMPTTPGLLAPTKQTPIP